ncbi:MAG: 3D domain-containing protein [Lachnospiraceae bacterium]|nr:3D domain-containing protein [Lachnospiraceae bacterium]
MNENSNKVKSIIIEKTKELISEYGKIIGAVIVVLTILIVCGVTLAGNILDSKMPSGVMKNVSIVASDKEPFSGNTFYVSGISYAEMTELEDKKQAENIEKTENEIQDILTARQEEREKQAAQEMLNIKHQSAESYSIYDPSQHGAPVTGSQTVTAGANVQYTYADENGTYASLGEFELTAYCPCPICCGIYSNMTNPTTASGTRATQGRTIATDTSVIPFGSKVVINGKVYTAEDTGGAIKGNRIDIYFESHTEALYFGRQKAQVYLVQ